MTAPPSTETPRHAADPFAMNAPNLRRRAQAVYLACDEGPASDISAALLWAADEIECLTSSHASLTAKVAELEAALTAGNQPSSSGSAGPSSPGTADAFLIVKRGLFFRPNCQGYTGIRDEAGRYSEEAARYHAEHGECTLIHADDAPEFMPAAYSDLVIKHLTLQRDEMRREVERLRGVAQAAPEPDADLEHIRSALATLSDPLTIAVDGHVTGTARALAIVHAMRDIAATAALHLSAVTPSPGPGEAERLRKGIQDFLDGNHDNPRQHRPEPCRHGQRWYQGCELCDSEHLTKLLTGSSVPSPTRATPRLCSCKASARNGQHMAWCPAVSSTDREGA